jgi:iron complex outermembrane receptor protein
MSFKKFLFVVLLCTTLGSVVGQTPTSTIQLLDLDNDYPIINATYIYGEQKGISDQDGRITFRVLPGKKMTISHLSYGTWTWSDDVLREVIDHGVFRRRVSAIDFLPATVIALRDIPRDLDRSLPINARERLAHDATSILNQIPAFNSIRKGGNYGFDPVFRGFKYDQLNVVIDGAQSATAACPNRMDPPTSQMTPNMMKRIEILKGPYALRYGTGTGATINFVSEAPRFTEKTSSHGRVSSAYESNGDIRRVESRVGLSTANYQLSLFGAWAEGDDYLDGNGNTQQADFSRGSLGANLGLKLSEKQSLSASATYNRARDTDFPALPMDLREDDTWLFKLKHDLRLDDKTLKSWQTTVFHSFVDHRMDNLLKDLTPRMLNAVTDATTANYGARTEGTWQFNAGKIYLGADAKVEEAEGIRAREFLMGPNAGNVLQDNAWQDGQIRKLGLFGEWHRRTDNFDYVISARMDYNQADIKDPDETFVQKTGTTSIQQLNPSVSAGIIKTISRDFRASLWVGRAQRSGSLAERFINSFPIGQDPFEMLGTPDLTPEVNNQADLTINWNQEKTAVELTLFGAYLQDFITSQIDPDLSPRIPMSPGVRRFVNIERAFKTGFEASWTQQLPLNLQQQLSVAYTYGQDLSREEPLPEIAPLDLRFTLTGNYLDGRLRPEVRLRHVVEQGRISPEFGETVTPSFTLVDLLANLDFSEKVHLAFGANNLFDVAYYEHLTRSVRGTTNPIFSPGRNLFVNLGLSF